MQVAIVEFFITENYLDISLLLNYPLSTNISTANIFSVKCASCIGELCFVYIPCDQSYFPDHFTEPIQADFIQAEAININCLGTKKYF